MSMVDCNLCEQLFDDDSKLGSSELYIVPGNESADSRWYVSQKNDDEITIVYRESNKSVKDFVDYMVILDKVSNKFDGGVKVGGPVAYHTLDACGLPWPEYTSNSSYKNSDQETYSLDLSLVPGLFAEPLAWIGKNLWNHKKIISAFIGVSLLSGCLSQTTQVYTEEEQYMLQNGISEGSGTWKSIKTFDPDEEISPFEKILVKNPDKTAKLIDSYKKLPLQNQPLILENPTQSNLEKMVLYNEKISPELKEMILYYSLPEEIQNEFADPSQEFMEKYDNNGNAKLDSDEIKKILYNEPFIDSVLWEDLETHLNVYEKYPGLYPEFLGKDLGEIVDYLTQKGEHPEISYYLEENLYGKTMEPEEQEQIDPFFENQSIQYILDQTTPHSFKKSVLSKYPSLDLNSQQIAELTWLKSFIEDSLEKQRFPRGYLPSEELDILKQPFKYVLDDKNNVAFFIGETNYGSVAMIDWRAGDGITDTLIPSDVGVSGSTSLADYIKKAEFSVGKSTTFYNIYFATTNQLPSKFLIGNQWVDLLKLSYDEQEMAMLTRQNKSGLKYYVTIGFYPDGWNDGGTVYQYFVRLNFVEDNEEDLRAIFDRKGNLLGVSLDNEESGLSDQQKEFIYQKYGSGIFLRVLESEILPDLFASKDIFKPPYVSII